MVRSAGGARIQQDDERMAGEARVAIIVPVLNEYQRLTPCLEGLILQGTAVHEILLVDGGSTDGTQDLVAVYSQRDPRVRLVDASPVPAEWNGKAWGLQTGLPAVQTPVDWILTLDADVQPARQLTPALLGRANQQHLSALSVATRQEIASVGEGLLHPSFLTTLVYRFGMPGKAARNMHEVQANGQCFLLRRSVLDACGGFINTRSSICEDVTIARLLTRAGYPVGFFEADDLITVKMYSDWRELWHNWSRSLPMHDYLSGPYTALGWLEVALVQALPLPCLLFLLIRRKRGLLVVVNGILAAIRIGVLFGTSHAYKQKPWSYWLSPLCDLPVTLQLARMVLQRRHVWRGRVIVRQGGK
jgi:dolichol-phosphate mannosyltransferase